MFQSLRDISIDKKLTLLVLTFSGMMLLLACVVFIIYDYNNLRNEMIGKTHDLATIVSSNTLDELENADAAAAQRRRLLPGLRSPHRRHPR